MIFIKFDDISAFPQGCRNVGQFTFDNQLISEKCKGT